MGCSGGQVGGYRGRQGRQQSTHLGRILSDAQVARGHLGGALVLILRDASADVHLTENDFFVFFLVCLS